ncbi:MAG: hypothetical protein ACKV22_30335 [Bryobacteraceae bacterium]
MGWRTPGLTAMILILLTACGRQAVPPVQDLAGGSDVSRFALTSIKGTRDGERLNVLAVFGDGARELRVDLQFITGSPTRLTSGRWSGLDGEGQVRERSVTFLGGQSGPPSIGGRFDLTGPDHVPRYRVTIPLQPLRNRL